MSLPNWTLALLTWCAFLHVSQFFVCDESLPAEDSNPANAFETFQAYGTFEACDGTEQWLSLTLFIVGTFPIILILAGFLFLMFNNAVTGTTLALLLIVSGLIALFT